MIDDGGRKRFILLLAGFILVVGLVFGAYQLFKYKFKADEITGVPTAPTGITAADNSDKTAITLNWQDVKDSTATDYKIERSASIWDDFTTIATQASSIKTYTDSNIVPGQRYYYKIIGHNSNGYSVNSKVATPTRVEYKDYLAGIGEMETSFTTTQQRYSLDPKYQATNGYINETVDSTTTNSVASAWRTYYSTDLDPGTDTYAKITTGGETDTNQQCFGVNYNTKNSGNSRIVLRTYLDNNIQINADEYVNGDTIRFVVDKLSYKDDAGLPSGAFSASLQMGGSPVDYAPITNMPNLDSRPTSIDVTSTVAIPGSPGAKVKSFFFDFTVDIGGADKLGSKTPGICLDGAHFYIKKAGEADYKIVTVPVKQDHLENSYLSHAETNQDNPYYVALNYDDVSLAYGADYLRLPAKYFNPNIKFFSYTARSLSDYRSDQTTDPVDASFQEENKFAALLRDHSDWFYTYDPAKLQPPSGDTRDFTDGVQDLTKAYKKQKLDGSFLDYVFDDYYQTEYLNNISDPVVFTAYTAWWRQNAASLAKKRGFEGVFLDVSAMRTVAYDKVYPAVNCAAEGFKDNPDNANQCIVYDATISQSQAVLKAVIPYLKDQGLLVTMNCGGCHLGQESADTFFDPTNVAAGNTVYNTPNSHFQEHSFIGITPREGLLNANSYRQVEEWNNTIADIEKYQSLNANIPEGQKKVYYVSSYGFNKTSPDPSGASPKPADPINNVPGSAQLNASLDNYDTGWANHIIASYLMGSNPNTYLSIIYDDWVSGAAIRKEYPLDRTMLDKLGQAKGKRQVQFEGVSRDFNCTGSAWSLNCWKEAVNYRPFDNGLVVDNADTGEFDPKATSHPFVMPGNYVDEYGRKYATGTTITLKKRTGRIFFKADKLDKPSVSVTRTKTYSGSTALSGTTDLFATSVTVNGQTANINTTNHTWTLPSLSLNFGANNISIINSGEGVSSDPETVSINRRKIGDANGDNSINKYDFSSLMLNWNRFETSNLADFNEDGSVGKIDFSMMMLNWGK